MNRRQFLVMTAATLGAVAVIGDAAAGMSDKPWKGYYVSDFTETEIDGHVTNVARDSFRHAMKTRGLTEIRAVEYYRDWNDRMGIWCHLWLAEMR